jgi:hypothetical protein
MNKLAFIAILVAATPAIASPLDDLFINQVYSDLLNRAPSPLELSQYETYLAANGRQLTAFSILTSTECRTDVVASYYPLYLHRTGTSLEESPFVQALNTGSTRESVESSILTSPEYFTNRGAGTNAGFVDALYSDLLNRTPSALELSPWLSYLGGGGTRDVVASDILASTEYRDDLVNTWYLDYLRRPVDSTGLATFVGQLSGSSTDEFVISEILGSDEYYNRLAAPEPASLTFFPLAATLLIHRRRTAH